MTRRKCWKYVPTECEFKEIKNGDIYRLEKADPEDHWDSTELFRAIEDAHPNTDPPGSFVVTAERLVTEK